MRFFRDGFEKIYDNNYNKYLSYINNHQQDKNISDNIFNFNDLFELFDLKYTKKKDQNQCLDTNKNNDYSNNLNYNVADSNNNSNDDDDDENDNSECLFDFINLKNEKIEQNNNYLNSYINSNSNSNLIRTTNLDASDTNNLDNELLKIKLRLEKFNSIFFNKELLDNNYSKIEKQQYENGNYNDNLFDMNIEDISNKIKILIDKINNIKGSDLYSDNQYQNISNISNIDFNLLNQTNGFDSNLDINTQKKNKTLNTFSPNNLEIPSKIIKNTIKQNLDNSLDNPFLNKKKCKTKISQNKLINIVKNIN